jgi:hypothetical protein
MLHLPELPLCPIHKGQPVEGSFASCHICWEHFYITFEHQPIIDRLNRRLIAFNEMYHKALEKPEV